eukprot:6064036-Pyramimonas_sp.AAC.1
MVESENETKPEDEEKQDRPVTGYGGAPGGPGRGSARRAGPRAAAVSKPALVRKQETVRKEVRFEDEPLSAAPSEQRR